MCEMYKIWIYVARKVDMDRAEEIARAIAEAAVKFEIDPLLIAGIVYTESGFNRFAMGDWENELDCLDESAGLYIGSYRSFGLMQINTTKPCKKRSTFDILALKLAKIDKRYEWLKDEERRNKEVVLARRGDMQSILFNIKGNILLGSVYLCEIIKKRKVKDPYEIAQLYNRGIYAELVDEWIYSERVLKTMKEISAL